MTTAQTISSLVESQLPEFVREDHPLFLQFLQAYYQYLEQSNTTLSLGKTIERATNMKNYRDVDNTISDFEQFLYDKFLQDFPVQQLITNPNIILKRAKDFYRSKGTEKSYRFLFRALYGQEIDFYFPKNDVLIASSGTWYIAKSFRLNNLSFNPGTGDPAITTLSDFQRFVNTQIK